MTALFNYRDDSAEPLLVRLDTLRETHGIEPGHIIAARDAPLIINIGAGRYLVREDLERFLHHRAEEALARRRTEKAARQGGGNERFYSPAPETAAA